MKSLVSICALVAVVVGGCARGARRKENVAQPSVAAPAAVPPPVPAPLAAPADPRVAPAARETLLVLPLRADSGLEGAARALDEMILTAIHKLDRYKVLGPGDLNALLGVEQMKDAMGCDDVACAAEIGGALGAPYLVAGTLARLDDQAVLSLRLMDTRVPAVLERATARGGTSAETLTQMMSAAVGEVFRTQVALSGPVVGPAGETYADFQAAMTALGKRMAQNEYTEMLADLDRYEHAHIPSPPNVDVAEILTFYRVTACMMLKRGPCLEAAARAYLARWPKGMYAVSVQGYVDQVQDAALQQEAKRGELMARIEEIKARHRAGKLSEEEALEQAAYAYFGAGAYEESIQAFRKLVQNRRHDPDQAMDLVKVFATALQQAGRFDEARRVLEKAQQVEPKLFRLKGLHHQLRSLPR
ncbi:MAG: hypothetical protein HYZ27_00400 [Deltaproteobacteria bacterium]|nr:hypothetical protein [Deltaproteobacteria bacterium]